MTTLVAEQIHHYPRRIRWIIEAVSAVAIAVTSFTFGRDFLRYLWYHQEIDTERIRSSPVLQQFVKLFDVKQLSEIPEQPADLVPGLLLLGLALLITLLLRNAFPTIRTSGRGMLVEFAGDWLPINWEDISAVKATESPAGRRYVLLVQTRNKALTSWHRFYSVVYRLGFRRGFFVTSSIQSFDQLVKTVLHESDRVSKIMSLTPARLDERASSPLFAFLLSPVGFFSRSTASVRGTIATVASAAAATAASVAPIGGVAPIAAEQGVVETTYPFRIRQLVTVVAGIIAGLGVLQYLSYWRIFIGKIWVHGPQFFRSVALPVHESTLWILLAGHLMLLLLAPALAVILNLLPDLRAQPDGLAVRYFKNWILLPWQNVTRVDAADLSEQNHVLLLEGTPRYLRPVHRAASLLFDGRSSPGILVTSAVSNFEPLLQRTLLAISRTQPANPEEPVFRDNASAWGIRLLLSPSATIDRLVAEAREDESTQTIDLQRAKQLLTVPAVLAAFPALILLATLFVEQMFVPTPLRIMVVLALFVWGLLEWPLAATVAQVVESDPSIDAEQARPFYLLPIVQIPRILPMSLAYILAVLSIPVLPTLLWLGAACWSFLLTAGLYEEMYDWHGAKLLGTASIPLIFQFLTLIAFGSLT